MARQAKTGDTVKVHYTGTLGDGEVFDSSRGGEPLEFTLGSGDVIPGFDQAVAGMEVGQEKTITIESDDAYGPHREELLLTVPRDQFPADVEPEPGQQFQVSQGDTPFLVTLVEVSDDKVVLDANHPLAGQDLTFALELVDIR